MCWILLTLAMGTLHHRTQNGDDFTGIPMLDHIRLWADIDKIDRNCNTFF